MRTQGYFRVIPDSAPGDEPGTIDNVTENPLPPTGAGTSSTHGVTDELRALRRSSSDRVIAGVLGGLGTRMGIDPVVLRVVTAVLALFGGVGVLLYAIAWLLVPAEDEAGSVLDQALGRVEPRETHAGPLAVGLAVGIIVSFGIVVSGSMVSGPLLALAAGGAFLVLRRRDDDGDGHPAEVAAQPPEPDYPLSWPPAEAQVQSENTERTAVSDEHPEAATDKRPESDRSRAAAHRTTGPAPEPEMVDASGWPDGPDWQHFQPEWAAEPEPAAPAKVKKRSPLNPIILSAAILAVGVLAINDVTWATFHPALYVAVPLAVIGAGLVIGSWFGRSRGLIVLGIILSLALIPATWVPGLNGPSGDLREEYSRVDELPARPVEIGVGSAVYDLSDLELNGATVEFDLELGAGEVTIFVPEEVTLNVELSMGAGTAIIRPGSGPPPPPPIDGVNREVTQTYVGTDPEAGTINLGIEAGLGEVKVIDR